MVWHTVFIYMIIFETSNFYPVHKILKSNYSNQTRIKHISFKTFKIVYSKTFSYINLASYCYKNFKNVKMKLFKNTRKYMVAADALSELSDLQFAFLSPTNPLLPYTHKFIFPKMSSLIILSSNTLKINIYSQTLLLTWLQKDRSAVFFIYTFIQFLEK